MKYVVVLGDGMADLPLDELGGLTPLQKAKTPNMDFVAQNGRLGLVRTIPKGMAPSSDTANLSVLGYAPERYYTSRSSLEATSLGLTLSENDLAYRCNLVTLKDDIMLDHSAGEITTQEAKVLIEDLVKALNINALQGVELHAGTSYRHSLILRDSTSGAVTHPPHDYINKPWTNILPSGVHSELFNDLMKKSQEFLATHEINQKRIQEGKNPANSMWIWAEGTAPALPLFYDKYKKSGSVISAVDLIKGLGLCAGFDAIRVVGATGTLYTNYAGKVAAALEALESRDFVYVHIEAPDECGHRGNIEEKLLAIEYVDQKVLAPILEGLNKRGWEYSIMVMPDHPTPISIRTHTDEPVPFAYYRSDGSVKASSRNFDEASAEAMGDYIAKGHDLMGEFLREK